MRRLVLLLLCAAWGSFAACASIQRPPGGPLRTVPPVLLTVTPDSGALNVKDDKVVFTFDEVINDRPSGAPIENMFLVSPAMGAADVDWKRSRIEVKAHKGFKPDIAYAVTMLPGISDQRGNVLKAGRTVIFSTGADIPPYSIDGRVFDWMRNAVAPGALVQVIRPDSLTWSALADSTGQFSVGPLPRGNYVVRAIIDLNSNRALDRNEAFDTVSVALRDTLPFIELLAAERDTTGPRIVTATPTDSLTIVLSFDKPVPTSALDTASFIVQAADSSRLHVARVLTRAHADAMADSARRDSAARSDTTHRAAPTRVSGAIPARRDSVPREIRPSRPAPSAEIVVILTADAALHAQAEYRVSAVRVRSIAGLPNTSDRTFTVHPAAPRPLPAAVTTPQTPPRPAASTPPPGTPP